MNADAGPEAAGAHGTAGDDPGPPPPPDDLPVDYAVAFSVQGYDPDDPWNAALCVETERVVTVLPLTPKTLGGLLTTLTEVDQTQRQALGVDKTTETGQQRARPRASRRIGHAARVMTGNQSVHRLWNASTRGQVIIIGCVVLFVLVGVILSLM